MDDLKGMSGQEVVQMLLNFIMTIINAIKSIVATAKDPTGSKETTTAPADEYEVEG